MRYRDLGMLLIEVDDGPRPLGGRKPAAVLARLLIDANRRVSTDRIMDALWGSDVTPGSAATVESHVARLRRVLEPGRAARQEPTVLVTDVGGYRLLVARDQVDSLAFEQSLVEIEDALAAGDPLRAVAISADALARWRGRPYEPFADEPWAESAAANLERLREVVRERRIEALLAAGEADRAVLEADAAVVELPLRERLWAHLMLGLYRGGRVDDALGAYQRARQTLAVEVGLDPGVELEDLQRRILGRDPGLELIGRENVSRPATAPAHLPGRLAPLIGRQKELARLADLIGNERMVTIVGAAGCGKTRLVIEVARGAAAEFPDGAWFVDLSTVDDGELVIDTVISTIGLTAPPVGSALDALRSFARHRRMLIVLDNCEHVLSAVETVTAALLDDSEASAVLSTSREPIGSVGEIIWTLAPLAVPGQGVGDEPPTSAPALEVFLARLRAADPQLKLSTDELRTAAQICIAVDGVPLALELAAARVRSCTLREIAEQVTADPSELSRLGGLVHDHRRTVRSAIDWSHRLLTPAEQAVHRRLAVLPGPFSRACAAAVAADAQLPSIEVADVLDQLVHRSMLEAVRLPRSAAPGQFRQLATVRGHAQHQLTAARETEETIARRDLWLDDLLSRGPRATHPDHGGWYEELDDAFPILRAALRRRVVERADPDADAFMSSLKHLWFFRSRAVEGERWLLNVVDHATHQGHGATSSRFALAALMLLRGRADLALPHLRIGLTGVDSPGHVPQSRLTRLGDELSSVGLSAATRDERDIIATVSTQVARLADVSSDDALALQADGLACIAELPRRDLPVSAARASAIFDAASDRNVLLAAWMACGVRTTIARLTGEPLDGLLWSDRTIETYIRLGGQSIGLFLETRANFTALAEQPTHAARLYAASRHEARRAGRSWPRRQLSADLLERTRDVLGPEQFAAAWNQGGSAEPTDLLTVH